MEVVGPFLLAPLFVLLLIGVPIAFSLGLSSAIFLVIVNIPGLDLVSRPIPMLALATEMFSGINQFALLALPMFILSGELMHRFNIIDNLIGLSRLLIGWTRGGLGHTTILASAMFAFISGSALATAASIGPTMVPTMIRERYPNAYAASLCAAAAMLGPLIPPSTPMIIVGSQLGISIGGMFVGGIVPGLLLTFVLMGLNGVLSRGNNFGEIHKFTGIGPILRGSVKATPALTVPMVLLGGIVFGVFTPTEAGAVTVLYALLLGGVYFRTLTSTRVLDALRATTRVTASVLLIVAAALVFNRIMTFFRVPEVLLDGMLRLSTDPVALTLIIIAFLLVVGTFMDELSNMLILGPLLMPVCTSPDGIGMHPIQYGLFLMTAILLGLLTPPLSLLLNVVAPIGRVSIERVSVAVLPFFAAEVAVLLVMAFVPAVTLTLPRLFGFA